MRDEQERERHPVLQLGEQVEHLGLDGDIERGDGLVEHDDVGLERERAGDPDALALAAGELVRVPGRVLGPQPHHLQQLGNALGSFRPATLDDERLAQHVDDAHARVQRRVRVLEHDLQPPAERPQLAAGELLDLAPVEADHARRRIEQAQHEPARRRLAAPRLPHQPDGLAPVEREAHAVDRVHDALLAPPK